MNSNRSEESATAMHTDLVLSVYKSQIHPINPKGAKQKLQQTTF